jgi:hypothetical protein
VLAQVRGQAQGFEMMGKEQFGGAGHAPPLAGRVM